MREVGVWDIHERKGDIMVERGGCAPDRLCPGLEVEVRCELCLEGFGRIR